MWRTPSQPRCRSYYAPRSGVEPKNCRWVLTKISLRNFTFCSRLVGSVDTAYSYSKLSKYYNGVSFMSWVKGCTVVLHTVCWTYIYRLMYVQLSLCFNGHFPGEPGLASAYWSKEGWRWWWQLDYWSYKSCKAPVKSSPPTSSFLQAGCPSYRQTNGVKALKGLMYIQSVPHI